MRQDSTASRLYLEHKEDMVVPPRPAPLASNALLASARRITAEDVGTRPSTNAATTTQGWQEEAWDMIDLVGEQRFLAHTLAGRLSQAQFYIGRINPDAPRDRPEAVEEPEIVSLLDPVGGTHAGRTQMIKRLAINLFVAGDGWLAGVPRWLIPGTVEYARRREVERIGVLPLERIEWNPPESGIDIDDLEWLMLSVSEVSRTKTGKVEIRIAATSEGKIEVSPDDIYLIRVWNPHPRRAWEADSPTRASLPVLRELVGLTMDVSAMVQSRLAGAGLLIVPSSAQRALAANANATSFEEETEDLFTEALMEAMLTPIKDRGNASALVPLVVTVPDEAADKFHYIQFHRDLTDQGTRMRDESIRRLALGQDAPPELLLGTGGMNHWGAWLVREDVVTTHLEPPLALICDALTTQYLWPLLAENFDMAPEEYRNLVVWYDVSDLITRPNRAGDAKELHDKGVIGDEALRRETGFDESDAPLGAENEQPIEVTLALSMVRANPSLMAAPGLTAVVEQIRATLAGESVEPVAVETARGGSEVPAAEQESSPGEPPATADEATTEVPESIAAAAGGLSPDLEAVIDEAYANGSIFSESHQKHPVVDGDSFLRG